MKVLLDKVGKKFIRQWVFKDITREIQPGSSLGITGPNGSGKSTLLRILSGWLSPSRGGIVYIHENLIIEDGAIYQYVDYAAPYLEMIEEFTLREFLEFHFRFKKIRDNLTVSELMKLMYLEDNGNKFIRHFSSGMKQRLRLGLGFYSESPLFLLDEPTSNLDEKAKNWYFDQIRTVLGTKTVIIASNQPEEYSFCDDELSIQQYTKKH